MIGMISNLPMYMFIINMIFPIGSIVILVIPIDIPTFPCAEQTSKNVFSKEDAAFVNPSTKTPIIRKINQRKVMIVTSFIISSCSFSDISFPSNLYAKIRRGDEIALFVLHATDFERNTNLYNFIPPHVAPAAPPIIIAIEIKSFEFIDQLARSAVAKPVVVWLDIYWKNEYRKEVNIFPS